MPATPQRTSGSCRSSGNGRPLISADRLGEQKGSRVAHAVRMRSRPAGPLGVVASCALLLTACTNGHPTVRSTGRVTVQTTIGRASTSTSPVPFGRARIATWRVLGDTPLPGTTAVVVICLAPEPPAPCTRLDGAISARYASGTAQPLEVSVHFAPVAFTEAQFAANLTMPECGGPCRPSPTEAAGHRAWLLSGATRSGDFGLLVARLSDTRFVSLLQWCGDVCDAPFPIERAQQLISKLTPVAFSDSAARWHGPVVHGRRRLAIPAHGGRGGCDVSEPFVDPAASYSVAERILTPLSDLGSLCGSPRTSLPD